MVSHKVTTRHKEKISFWKCRQPASKLTKLFTRDNLTEDHGVVLFIYFFWKKSTFLWGSQVSVWGGNVPGNRSLQRSFTSMPKVFPRGIKDPQFRLFRRKTWQPVKCNFAQTEETRKGKKEAKKELKWRDAERRRELCQRAPRCPPIFIQFQLRLHTINWCHVAVVRLIWEKSFDGLDSFGARFDKSGYLTWH